MGQDGFIIFWAKSCLILQNKRGGAFNAPCQLTYILDPTGNRVKTIFYIDQIYSNEQAENWLQHEV